MLLEFYWHIHHDILLEYLTEPIENRIKFIKENKPISEIETRLKWMTPVKGELPIEIVEARKAYDEARKACDEAWKAYDEAMKAFYDEAMKAYDEARKACDEALAKHSAEIVDLHRIEHPDCPWDYARNIMVLH